ncbi:hypothetical protein V9789_004211 [Vibrio vulnificus]|nr:hypothetical protein [Vibrio vulnificus]EHR7291080.1 hypothetical protein [Vibrio parahaemolyticus]EHK9054745.1 hypothetical protein [Vibrio vulnificus]ELP4435398.1 hypothetical protein [Vibrio vulnificus]HAS8342243.1 hypothetical protein [Vibrio vulnificus]
MEGNKDIKTILDDFFSSSRLKPVLRSLSTGNITGWEIWLQIEFAHFLTSHKSNPNWYREYELIASDWNKKTRPDFWLWSKQDKKYVLIEFKQAVNSNQLIDLMNKDARKTFATEMICVSDKNVYEFVGQIFVGIFKRSGHLRLELTNCTPMDEVKTISETDYQYVVFSRTNIKVIV